MAEIRFKDLQKGTTDLDFRMQLMMLAYLITEEEYIELQRRFDEYHKETQDFDAMPWWRFIYQNVDVKLKQVMK